MDSNTIKGKIIEQLKEKYYPIFSQPVSTESEIRNKQAALDSYYQELFFVERYVFTEEELKFFV